jgi:hypothetical protein
MYDLQGPYLQCVTIPPPQNAAVATTASQLHAILLLTLNLVDMPQNMIHIFQI